MDVHLDFQKTSKEFNTLMTILKGYIQGFIYEVKESDNIYYCDYIDELKALLTNENVTAKMGFKVANEDIGILSALTLDILRYQLEDQYDIYANEKPQRFLHNGKIEEFNNEIVLIKHNS